MTFPSDIIKGNVDTEVLSYLSKRSIRLEEDGIYDDDDYFHSKRQLDKLFPTTLTHGEYKSICNICKKVRNEYFRGYLFEYDNYTFHRSDECRCIEIYIEQHHALKKELQKETKIQMSLKTNDEAEKEKIKLDTGVISNAMYENIEMKISKEKKSYSEPWYAKDCIKFSFNYCSIYQCKFCRKIRNEFDFYSESGKDFSAIRDIYEFMCELKNAIPNFELSPKDMIKRIHVNTCTGHLRKRKLETSVDTYQLLQKIQGHITMSCKYNDVDKIIRIIDNNINAYKDQDLFIEKLLKFIFIEASRFNRTNMINDLILYFIN